MDITVAWLPEFTLAASRLTQDEHQPGAVLADVATSVSDPRGSACPAAGSGYERGGGFGCGSFGFEFVDDGSVGVGVDGDG